MSYSPTTAALSHFHLENKASTAPRAPPHSRGSWGVVRRKATSRAASLGENHRKGEREKQMEQREYHSQLHGFTWWSPSLKGQLRCNGAGPARRYLTVLSGIVQKWIQSSGDTQSWRERREPWHPHAQTRERFACAGFSPFHRIYDRAWPRSGGRVLHMNVSFLCDSGDCDAERPHS